MALLIDSAVMTRRQLVLLVLAFLITRGAGVFLATNPNSYGTPFSQITFDPTLYQGWAHDIIHEGIHPYSGVRIEYPPGVMPFTILPEIDRPETHTYLVRFVLLMVLVDASAFAALLLLARRHGSNWGPWLWIAGTVLLGPIIYTRLDLIPAAATIWALERASARSWFGTGGWLAFGVLSKVYPILLIPIAMVVAPRKRQLVFGALIVAGLVLFPYIGSMGAMYDSVFGFHSSRGVQVESTWGGLLMAASKFGYQASTNLSFGAFHVDSSLSPALKILGNILSVIALGVGMFMAARYVKRADATRLAATMYGTLAVILGVGTVFSPQFVMWLIALAAVGLCAPNLHLRGPLLTLLPVAVVTQVIYPFIYEQLLGATPAAIAVLLSRNLLVLIAGIGTWAALPLRDEPQAELIQGPVAPSAALAVSGT